MLRKVTEDRWKHQIRGPLLKVQYMKCRCFKSKHWSFEVQQGNDQMAIVEKQERIAAIEEAFHESRSWALRAVGKNRQLDCNVLRNHNLSTENAETQWKIVDRL